eukprot:m.276296 g.276296  ORF g.276296 m.276296 type:complete len:101 (-) comp16299_c0_seq3:1275-1577(-)
MEKRMSQRKEGKAEGKAQASEEKQHLGVFPSGEGNTFTVDDFKFAANTQLIECAYDYMNKQRDPEATQEILKTLTNNLIEIGEKIMRQSSSGAGGDIGKP